MNAEFVQEIVEHERMPHRALLTGWETIVFQVEDEGAGERPSRPQSASVPLGDGL